MHRIGTFLLLECSPIRKKSKCLKVQIRKEQIGKSDILMNCHAIVPDIRSSGEADNIPTQIIDEFPAASNYGKLPAKCLVSSIRLIHTVRFFSLF